jgi:hypothetical protein
LLDRSQQHQHPDRGGDREQTNDARQAAEALFAPKPRPFKQLDQEIAPSAGDPVRRPRVLTISPTVTSHPQEPEAPISRKRPVKPKIPKSQFARIRAWLRYGMTTEQVADVYGVPVDEIERILGIAQ